MKRLLFGLVAACALFALPAAASAAHRHHGHSHYRHSHHRHSHHDHGHHHCHHVRRHYDHHHHGHVYVQPYYYDSYAPVYRYRPSSSFYYSRPGFSIGVGF